jgi:tetratricopeptide (TPR) repeat protein
LGEIQPHSRSTGCLDVATVAAFVDGALDSTARAHAMGHIASCADCSELVAEVLHAQEDLAEPVAPPADRPVSFTPAAPVAHRWRRPRLLAGVGGLVAIAASLLILFNRQAPLDPLVSIVGAQRLTMARPSGDFQYGPLRSPLRGSADLENLELRAEVARLQERAARSAAPSDLHAAGVARFLTGDPSTAVTLLERASESSPRDARVQGDLGAAYMTRFVERGDPADAAAALAALDKALALAPSMKEGWFNKALLLERLNRPADALAAWTKYLELPDAGGWRDEAIRHRDAVQGETRGR